MRWLDLFNDNPFILTLVFGYPVIKVEEQAHVSRQKLSGSDETITATPSQRNSTRLAPFFSAE